MKKILSLGLFFIGLTAATDTFRFTQCECISELNSFSSDEQDDFTTLTKPSGVFSCPGSGAFPDESGIVFNSPTAQSKSLQTSSLDASFFRDGVDLNGWHAVVSMTLELSTTPISTDFVVLNLLNGNSLASFELTTIKGFADTSVSLTPAGAGGVTQKSGFGSIETTLIVGMAANVITGSGTVQALFVCLKLGTLDLTCEATPNTAISATDFTSPQIELFTTKSSGSPAPDSVQVSMVQFGNGLVDNLDISGGENINVLIANQFDGFTLPPVVSLPVEGSVTLETEEDTASSVNLTSLLTGGSLDGNTLTFALDVDSPPGNGTLDDTNLPIVLYTPNKDFNGDDSIGFTYSISSPFECSNTVSSTITVTPVNDPPVAVTSQVKVFANIPQEINAEVGTDVDQTDDTFVGTITFTNPDQLPGVISAACDPLAAITTLNVNGNVTFCFSPDGTMTNGNDATLSFTVEDGGGLSDSGDITLVGNNPVFPPEDSPFETGAEDQELDFSLGNDKFGLKAEGAAGSVTIGIRVTKLPDEAIGTLTNSNGDAIVVGESSADFDVTDSLKFTPASKVFNTVKGQGVDEGAVPVGGCSSASRVTVNGESVCPFSFEYTVFLDNVQSDPKEAFFLIDAVDNGNPVITVNGNTEAVVEANGLNLVNGLAVASVSGVAISSDDGADVFLMDMRIQGFGTSFLVEFPENRAGFDLSEGATEDGGPVAACDNTLCNSVRVTGIPAQLAEVANNLDLRVPQDSTAPAVVYNVDTLGGSFNNDEKVRIEITLNFKEPQFFDSTANLAAVGGGAGILVLSLTVFLIFRITRANRIGEDNILQLAEAQVGREELEKRQKKKRAKESSRKTEYEDVESSRKKETSVEDNGFMDWEKHIDKETNETYFFNPKTGESRWDPPNMDDGI